MKAGVLGKVDNPFKSHCVHYFEKFLSPMKHLKKEQNSNRVQETFTKTNINIQRTHFSGTVCMAQDCHYRKEHTIKIFNIDFE